MNPQMTPIIPLEQAIVSLAGHDFLVVRLPDGRYAVVFRHLCEALNLNRRGQEQRIQRNPMLSQHFLLVLIQTPGGPQVVNALSVSVLSLWLGGFHITRLSEKKRALIMELQQHAEATFTGHFHTSNAQAHPQPKPSAPPKPGPESTLPPPPPSPEVTPLSVSDLLRELLRHVEQKERSQDALVAHLDQKYHDLLSQLAEMQRHLRLNKEQIEALWSVIASSSRPGAPSDQLTADHQRTLGVLLELVHRQMGRPLDALERELLTAVGVKEVGQLREGQWDSIVGWIRQVMDWGTGTPP